ncbi:hypothetical protein ACLBXM_17950 [Xanthobacteraceae bacterium A53D]
MPWVSFTSDFDWRPRRGLVMAYRAGTTALVTTPCAKAAKGKGAAVSVPKPKEPADAGSR